MTGQCGAVSVGEVCLYEECVWWWWWGLFVSPSRIIYLSNKSASEGNGFMTTSVEISLYYASQWHKTWFQQPTTNK